MPWARADRSELHALNLKVSMQKLISFSFPVPIDVNLPWLPCKCP